MGQDMPKDIPSKRSTKDPQHSKPHERSDTDSTADSSLRSDASDVRTPTDVSDDDTGRATDPWNTVIIFDWDDTLHCTTALNRGQYTSKGFKDLAKAVASILTTASRLGEVMIITNGRKTWVEASARRHMPELLPVLQELKVVSARARVARRHPDDPHAWKRVAFEEVLIDERLFLDSAIGLNIVALGDQSAEIEAAHHIGRKLMGRSFVKTLKFQEQPMISDLICQLSHVEAELAGIVRQESSCYSRMVSSQASSWQVSTSVTVDYNNKRVDSVWSVGRTCGELMILQRY